MDDICAVHLAREQDGPAPFRNFVESYRAHPAGVRHSLLIIFKGFGERPDLSEYELLLKGIPYQPFFLPDEGFDITPYFRAVETFAYNYFCFLNSHSIILDDNWLAKMYEHARGEDVGVVGATGSWQSGYSYVLFEHGRPSAYTEFLRDYYRPRLRTRRELFKLSDELRDGIRRKPFHRLYYWGLVAPFYRVVNGVRYSIKDLKEDRTLLNRYSTSFEAFPAPHVRTNAFMIKRELMLGLQHAPIVNKMDAHLFESGKEGMTGQVRRAGLRTLVVGRDGRAYEPDQWHLSETLWQGEQRNLLVSDNQTNDYAHGSPQRRVFLSRVAWGDKALPLWRSRL